MTDRTYRTVTGKCLMAALALASVVALTGCSSIVGAPLGSVNTSVDEARKAVAAEHHSDLTGSDLVKDGYLTVGLQTERLAGPFYVSGDKGAIFGIDVDFASAVADQLGLKVAFVKVGDVDSALANGACDVVLDADPARLNGSVMVGSYYQSAVALFTKGEARTVNVEELNGKKVAVQGGSVSQGDLNRTSLSLVQATYVNLNECFTALEDGEVDYVLCDSYSGAYLASEHPGVSFAGALSTPVSMGAAVSSDKSKLLLAMQSATTSVLNDGSMEIIRSYWVPGLPELGDNDVIANVPQQVENPELINNDEPGNGSTAGSNAVILS